MSQYYMGFAAKRSKRPPRAKKAGKLNAAQRTMKYLRDRGWTAEVVEKFIHRAEGAGQKSRFAGGYRKDLFGFADVLAFRPDPVSIDGKAVHFLAIQTTSRQQIAQHLRDYRDVENYIGRGSAEQQAKRRKEHGELLSRIMRWLGTPCAVFLMHGWEPLLVPKKSGGEKVQWTLTERVVVESDLEQERF